jgi:ankyrin repeat protein
MESGVKIGQSPSIPLSLELRDDRDVLEVDMPFAVSIHLDSEPDGPLAPGLANTYLGMEVSVGERGDTSWWVPGAVTFFADIYARGGHAAVCSRATSLNEAMMWNCATRLRELIEAGGNPELANAFMEPPAPENLTTPLEHAVVSGDIALMRRLLYHGADPNWRGQDYTAFELAVVLGQVDAIEPLLEAHAQLTAIGPHGYTPLMLAAQFNRPEVVAALLRAGAGANQPVPHRSPRGDGRTALMHALEEEKSEVRRLLLDAGANPLHPTADGFSPFLYASEHPRMHAFREFLARGYPVNASTQQGFFAGKTPFMSVAVRSRHEDLDALVRLGADPRLKDRSGHDALFWTKQFGREENVRWIEQWLAARG